MYINKAKIEELVEQKWKNGCPMCGGHEWSFNDKMIVAPVQISEDRRYKLNGQIMPLAALICRNCGNTAFVNTLIVDALEEIGGVEEDNNGIKQ